MRRLSVNVNKIALLRNARGGRIPDLLHLADVALGAGAAGITVHPRPDLRHVRPGDVTALARHLRTRWPDRELNVEGNPFEGPRDNGYPGFLPLVEAAVPTQVTLVPDAPGQLTSDHGFRPTQDAPRLAPVVARLHGLGSRVSLFMDPEPEELRRVPDTGADRVELYTGPYAEAAAEGVGARLLDAHGAAAALVRELGLGLNAGHDLDLHNLSAYAGAVDPDEVSIGHALVADALERGLAPTVRAYLDALHGQAPATPPP